MKKLSKAIVNRFKILPGIFFFVLFSGIATFHCADGAELVDRIVAEVNDDIITLSELNEAMNPFIDRVAAMGYSENRDEVLFKIRTEVLSGLIDKVLTDQQIERLKITVSDKEVDDTIERIKETNFLTDERLRQKLKSEGMAFDTYKQAIKEQILRTKLVNREVKSKIVVTKEDIKAYYESHRDEFAGEQKYHLRNILLRVPSDINEDEKLEILKKVEGIRDKLTKGQPFELMAKTYSESSMASEGGDLGFFSFKDFSPKLQEIFKVMKAGDISPVLDTDQGYQIFLIEEIVKSPDKTLEEASREIQDRIYKEKTDEKFNAWLKNLHQQSHIKIIN